MNLEQYAHSVVALFGRARAFAFDELAALAARANITLVEGFDERAVLIVEGALMPTPLRLQAEALYETKRYAFVDIDEFERSLAKFIAPKPLLMSLKLSRDQAKLRTYLLNDYIDDALFLDLLRLYDFRNENFFENDDNRDVTAALIRRFYKDYRLNHNIQYANVGLINVVENTQDETVLAAIFALEPLQKALRDPNDPNANLLRSILLHPQTPTKILETVLRRGEYAYLYTLAQRTHLGETIQKALLEKNDPKIDATLAASPHLLPTTITTLVNRGYAERIAATIDLRTKPDFFDLLRRYSAIASNPTLDTAMQRTLFCEERYRLPLANNPDCVLTQELLALNDPAISAAVYTTHDVSEIAPEEGFEIELARNPSTPPHILQRIFEKNIDAANEALAANPSTPVAILYQLSFDMRYAKYVKVNPSYTEHIKTTHAIGIFE